MRININHLDKAENLPFRTSRKHINRSYHSGDSGKDPYYFIKKILKGCVGKPRKVIFDKLKEKSQYSNNYPWRTLNEVIDREVYRKHRNGLYSDSWYRPEGFTLKELKERGAKWGNEYYWDEQDRLQVIKRNQNKPMSKRARYKAKLERQKEEVEQCIANTYWGMKGEIIDKYGIGIKSRYIYDKPPKIFMGYKYYSQEVRSKSKWVGRTSHHSKEQGGGKHYNINRREASHFVTKRREKWVQLSWGEYYHLLDNPKFDFLQHEEMLRIRRALYNVGRKRYLQMRNTTEAMWRHAALST